MRRYIFLVICIVFVFYSTSSAHAQKNPQHIIDEINKMLAQKTSEDVKQDFVTVQTYPIVEECAKDLYKAVKICSEAKNRFLIDVRDARFCKMAEVLFGQRVSGTSGSSADELFVNYFGDPSYREDDLKSVMQFDQENRYKSADIIDVATTLLHCNHATEHDAQYEICKKVEVCWDKSMKSPGVRPLINEFTYRQKNQN